MLNFTGFLNEKYEALGNPDPKHYTHLADYAFRGAGATGAAANVYKHMQGRSDSKSSMEPQKKTDGKVSVVTVRNSKDSPYHNPKYPESAVGVAYKGRMDAKSIEPKDKVSYSHEDIKGHYGSEHHLTPMLSSLLDHAHKIHGEAPIIQHDIHTTTPSKDIHYSGGKATWQPNVVRNSTTDAGEIKKLKRAKIVIASHTAMDKDFTNPRGLRPGKDIKSHPDVYNVDLNAPKVSSKALELHNKNIGQHVSNKETRGHLDTIAKASYNKHLEPFVNSKIRTGEYGGEGQKPLTHKDFRSFVANAHDKEIAKVTTDKAKQAKTAAKEAALKEVDAHKASINKVFEVHHAMTNAVRDYVGETHKADEKSPIKHEIPSEHGGFKPAPPEGYVPRGKHAATSTTKLNPRSEFNRANFLKNADLGKKKAEPVTESAEGKAVVIPAVRMQPFHRGHEALIKDALAKNHGPVHLYVTKNKPGDADNPLSAEHRISLIKHAFKDDVAAGRLHVHEGGSMFQNMSNFHQNNPNVTNAHVVLGKGREESAKQVAAYNGKTDKAGNVPYHFKQLTTSIRSETPGAHDTVRATELRNMAHSDASPEEKFKYFKDRMHPSIPTPLVQKTLDAVQAVKPKAKKLKEGFLSFIEYIFR